MLRGAVEAHMATITGDGFLTGGPDDDTITGGSGDDTLRGEGGNDVLRGRAGSDFLDGGTGNDRLIGGGGIDTINGGDGTDTAVFDGMSSDYVFEPGGPQGYLKVTNTADGSVDYVIFVEKFQFADKTIAASDIPSVFSGGSGSYLSETINGTAGNNRLEGSFGNDVLNGFGGNDFLYGGSDFLFHDEGNSGNDTLNGGAGNDWFDGGDGNDVLNGGAGLDRTMLILGPQAGNFSLADDPVIVTAYGTKTLISIEGIDIQGSSYADNITGGAAHDFLYGYLGNDRLSGAGGNDFIEGGAGNDSLFGNSGDDILFGGGDSVFSEHFGGNDRLFGGDGNDWLIGYDGDDQLDGGANRDILVGGDGSDRLTGGGGVDVFVFTASALGTSRTGERDSVTDFQKGTDKLDVSALYQSHPVGSVSAGSAAAGEAVSGYGLIYNYDGQDTYVYGDNDGSAGADFVIKLWGNVQLSRDDVIATEAEWTAVTGLGYAPDQINDEGMLHYDQPAPYYWYYAIGFDA